MSTFTGASILDWIKIIAGNAFIAILIVRSIGQYARSEFGDFAQSLIFAIVIAAIIYFPEQVISLMKGFWNIGGAPATGALSVMGLG